MKLGTLLPQVGRVAGPEAIVEVARAAEASGLDSVWLGDHVAMPADYESRYPLADDGRFPAPPQTAFLELFSTLGFVAAVTERVAIGTAVCVLPHRRPALLAKCAATVDVLSGGRLILGVGTGWLREELDLLGAPAKAGAHSRAMVRMAREAWRDAETPLEFVDGDVVVDGFCFSPSPLAGSIPVWVGGNAPGSLRWAAREGDGWLPAMHGQSPADLGGRIRELRETTAEHGRPAPTVGLFLPTRLAAGGIGEEPWRGKIVEGEAEGVARLIAGYGEAGVDHLVLVIGGGVEKRIATFEAIRAAVDRLTG